ncbi:MAG: DUF1552 domain-containing protein [Bryobacteraceae bacterium]
MTKRISRRTVLRGAGAALALPWMESMVSAATPSGNQATLSEPPLRSIFMYMPNGVRPDFWTPAGDGESYEITPHLKPLESLKNDFLLLENLWNAKTVGRNGHWPKVPAWLSGGYVERTSGDDLDSGGTTVDQLAAQRIGDRTMLPSFELGLEATRSGIDTAGGGFARMYGSFISWRDPHTPVPKEIVPQLAFDRLFRSNKTPVISSLNPNDPAVLTALQRDDSSILDMVSDQAKTLRREGSSNDRVRLDEYFESVRSVEQRLAAALRPQKRWINKGKFPLERPGPGIPATRPEHMRLMMDIMVLALWSDTTRIGTFMTADAQTNEDFSFLPGVKGGFHSLSHHAEIAATKKQYETCVTWHVAQVAYFLNKLKSLDEGGTSLLDNSMVMFGHGIKCGNLHLEENLPIALAGGGKGTLRGGRRLRYEKKTPLCNLYLSMLDRMGIKEKSFGDSTGLLTNLS